MWFSVGVQSWSTELLRHSVPGVFSLLWKNCVNLRNAIVWLETMNYVAFTLFDMLMLPWIRWSLSLGRKWGRSLLLTISTGLDRAVRW